MAFPKLVLLQPVLLLLLLILATSLNCLESNAIEWAELDKAQFISAAIQQFAVPKPSIPAGNVKEKMLFESAKAQGKLLVNLAKFPLMQVKLPKEKEPEDLRKLARNLGLVVGHDGNLLNVEQIAKEVPDLVEKEDPRKLLAENAKRLSDEQKQFIAQMIKLHASGEGVEFARAKFEGKILMALNGRLAMKVQLEREDDRRAVQVNLAVDPLTGELDLLDIYTNQMGKEDKRELVILPMKRAKTVKLSAKAEMASSTNKLAKKDGQEPETEASANATAPMPEVGGTVGAKITKNGLRKVPEALPGKKPEESDFIREFKLMKAKWQAQKEQAEETGGTNEE